jgi:hypothetical protein
MVLRLFCFVTALDVLLTQMEKLLFYTGSFSLILWRGYDLEGGYGVNANSMDRAMMDTFFRL